MSNLFVGAEHAAIYAKFRPTTPQIVVDKIISYLGEKLQGPYESAIDVGCGTGQSTRILAPFFRQITGTDVSDDQVSEAKLDPANPGNVSFQTAAAENLPFEEHSNQLIIASECFHYFNQESFFKEAERILKENGVLVIHGYWIPSIQGDNAKDSKIIQEITNKFHDVDLGKYRDHRSDMVQQLYAGVNLPFRDTVRDDCIFVSKETTLDDYFGYVTSWSTYQKFLENEGTEAATDRLSRFRKDIEEYLPSGLGGDNPSVKVVSQHVLLMGRK